MYRVLLFSDLENFCFDQHVKSAGCFDIDVTDGRNLINFKMELLELDG